MVFDIKGTAMIKTQIHRYDLRKVFIEEIGKAPGADQRLGPRRREHGGIGFIRDPETKVWTLGPDIGGTDDNGWFEELAYRAWRKFVTQYELVDV